MSLESKTTDTSSKTFTIITILASIVFIILGSQTKIFSEFISTFTPFAVFLLALLIIIHLRTDTYRKMKEEDNLGEVIVYLTEKDIFRDFLVNSMVGLVLIVVPVINRDVSAEDVIQAIGIMVFYYFWHRLLFRKKPGPINAVSLNNLDRMMDEVVVFIMPVIILTLALIISGVDLIDFIQALAVFAIMFVWHILIFKPSP